MDALLSFVNTHPAVLSTVGAVALFLWPIVQFVLVRKRDQEHREFEVYHRLIKELVVPDQDSKSTWIDRQAAIVFELRSFRKYREYSLRMLLGLQHDWNAAPLGVHPRLLKEIEMTIDFLRKRVT